MTSAYQHIQTLAQLQAIKNDLDGDYVLDNDIDATDTATWNWDEVLGEYQGFEPIGNESTPFTGIFKGSGYIISNLFINRPTTDYVGLFGVTNGGAIHRIGLENVTTIGYDYVGPLIGLAGYPDVSTIICFCYATGSAFGNKYVGGLIGGDGIPP